MTDQFGNNAEVELCKLCDTCGFINDSQVGVLRNELGFGKILENHILFPCHERLQAFNDGGSENEGTREMVEATGKLYVCTGLVQSLKKSKVLPKNRAMAYLMSTIKDDEIDERIMTIEETKKYHNL